MYISSKRIKELSNNYLDLFDKYSKMASRCDTYRKAIIDIPKSYKLYEDEGKYVVCSEYVKQFGENRIIKLEALIKEFNSSNSDNNKKEAQTLLDILNKEV
jgi:uncharacterized FlgJ-related protein